MPIQRTRVPFGPGATGGSVADMTRTSALETVPRAATRSVARWHSRGRHEKRRAVAPGRRARSRTYRAISRTTHSSTPRGEDARETSHQANRRRYGHADDHDERRDRDLLQGLG